MGRERIAEARESGQTPPSSVHLLSKVARPSRPPLILLPGSVPSITIPKAGKAEPRTRRLIQSTHPARHCGQLSTPTRPTEAKRATKRGGSSTLPAGEGVHASRFKCTARALHTQHHVTAQKTSLATVPLQAQAFSLPFYAYAYKLQEFPPCPGILCITKTPLLPLSREGQHYRSSFLLCLISDNDVFCRLRPLFTSRYINTEIKPRRNQLGEILPSKSGLQDPLIQQVFSLQLPNLLWESAASHSLPGSWAAAKKAFPSPPSYPMHTYVSTSSDRISQLKPAEPLSLFKLFSCRLRTPSLVRSKSVVN